MADLEIKINSSSGGGGFDQAVAEARKVESALKQVSSAAKVDGKVSMDLGETEAAKRILEQIDALDPNVDVDVTVDDSAVKATITTVKGLDGEDIDLKVIVDDAGIRRAEGDIRDLDSIPGPVIPVDVDTSEIAGSVEDAFGEIDPGNIAGTLQGKLTSALRAAGGIGAVVGLAAEAWGDDLAAGFGRGFSGNKNSLAAQIETGFDAVQLQPIGRAAGQAYSDGFGEGLHDLTVKAATLESSLRGIDKAMDLTTTLESAQVLEDHLGVGIPDSALLAARMIRTKLATDTVEAMDIMTYAVQTFGDTGIEALEVVKEFSPVFGRMKIDGAAGVDFIARSFAEGLLPTIDRGGELLEEFQIRITDLDSQDAIQQLGLDFQMISDLLANGKGNQALDLVATALLHVKDSSEQATLANIIFGAAMESAYDRPEVISRLQDLSRAQVDVAGTSEKAVENAKAMQTEWDKTGRVVEDLSSKVGVVALGAFNDMAGSAEQIADGFGLWGDASDNVSGKLEALGDGILALTGGPLATLVDDLTGIGTELASNLPFWQSWWGEADRAAESVGTVGNEVAQATANFGPMRDRIAEANLATADLTVATIDLDQALSEFAGRFDADQVFRRIEEDARAAIEATKDLTTADYDLATGFDITTEAGRAAETALEDLSLNTDQLTQAFRDGNASASDLAAGQQNVEATLRQVASQMGLNQDETDALIAKYGGVQREIYTAALFESENALASVLEYQRAIGAIPTYKQTTVATHFVTTGNRVYQIGGGFAHGGVVGAAASGGVHDGWTWVGEDGPELAKLAPGSQVATAGDSARMAAAGGGGAGPTIVVQVMGSVLSDRDLAERIKELVFAGDLQVGGRSGVGGGW